ncbi:leucine-rich repeat-containing protein let-4-like [Vespa mandarinia]|uniref:leucine-rich repeat-containing protein let-4-like n=1 Tax=Vespa mandarinia TaxID=7446 RepID=UPI001617A3D0|nr:leucine-rich repeat-containing protein let-4-like [Vespa mandarinia]
MWQSSTFITHMAIISMGFIHGVFATTISIYSKNFEEDLSLHFEEPMDKCDNSDYEIVKLVKMGINVLRENFIESANVRSINLEDNSIIDISPDAFKAIPNLICLNLGQNAAKNIFNKFLNYFYHPSLVKLNLHRASAKTVAYDYENLRSYPDTAIPLKSFLPHVTHLDISGNNLEYLPQYFKSSFPSLTHLYLSGNRLTNLDNIPPSTQVIYLERNDYNIKPLYFPKNISALFLNDNTITSYIRDFDNLNVLSIRNCKSYYSGTCGVEKCKNLVDLDMSSNKIKYIYKDDFETLKSLQRLSLDHNTLSILSFLTHLSSLTDLSIAYNNLTNITSDNIARLGRLKTLNLRGNRISIISENAFLNLNMLKKLDLAENKLTTLPATWMNTLTKLRYLNLQSNFFTSIENMSIYSYSNLNHLFVRNNSFIQIKMKSLERLPSSVVIHVT